MALTAIHPSIPQKIISYALHVVTANYWKRKNFGVRVFINDVIFMPSFVEIGRLVQKLGRGDPKTKMAISEDKSSPLPPSLG